MVGTRTATLCRSSALVDAGAGLRFTVRRAGELLPAFAVRHDGAVHAYVNRCAHRGVELDWEHGRFFDRTAHRLICATHGAMYDPATGACVGGPCRRGGLMTLPVVETDGSVYLVETVELELVNVELTTTAATEIPSHGRTD